MALSVPLSRFTPRVGGGSAFFVRPTSRVMKYRAICPSCGMRFSRALYFRWLAHVPRRCQGCGCHYKADTLWEYVGSGLLGVGFAISIGLGLLGVVSWPVSVILFLGVAATGCILFPYITPFVLIKDEHENP